MDRIGTLLVLISALPLLSAIATAALGARILRQTSHLPTIAAIVISFLCSFGLVNELVVQHDQSPELPVERVYTLWTWADVSDAYSIADGQAVNFTIDVTLRADALTAIMLVTVNFVSSLVAIYSLGYMRGDPGYWRFFTYISLFVFSMNMLVSVSNFLLLYVFWEAVGVCSYLLIGFWYQKPEAADAGKKAFLVNRVGDFGFALALFLIWTTYGTLNFHSPEDAQPLLQSSEVSDPSLANSTAATLQIPGILSNARIATEDYVGKPGSGHEVVALAICLLLMLGACGKSAQFPLHVWLPDAMEGPTPVSALIHAATMVTAGVYMVVRCTPLFMVSPSAQLIVACIGAATALMAALIALTQFDLKRVLAYSTISQLGYMFLALGTGTLAGITAGMFHLFTHAFFKALLFLGAGSVMHAMGGVIDMRQFGGLKRLMPVTCITFLIGCLALSGVFPFAGFWSKDGVVAAVHDKAHSFGQHTTSHGESTHEGTAETAGHASDVMASADLPELIRQRHAFVYNVLYWSAMLTGLLTAIYTFRAFWLTFFGQEQVPPESHGHAHESPWSMCGPLVLLAGCALIAGFWFDRTALAGPHVFGEFLTHAPQLAGGAVAATIAPGQFHLTVAAISTLMALVGIGLASYLYLGDAREISWLSSLMRLEWLSKIADADWGARFSQFPAVQAVDRGLRRCGLGWMSTILGYLSLLLLLVLASPILIGYFVSPYRLSSRKFYFDEIYSVLTVWPLRIAGTFSYWWDCWIVDGLVNLVGRLPVWLGSLMRSLQMGLVPFYALAMVLGMLILLATRIFMSS